MLKIPFDSPYFRSFFSFLIFSLFSLGFASSPRAETVTDVEITGNTKTDTSLFIKSIETTAGSAYSEERVNEDLKRLYKSGFFSDVQVEREAKGKGVKLIFHVQEKARVAKILVEGSKEISEEDVKGEITQKPYQALDEKKISESKEKIKAQYTKKGMGFALVTVETRPSKESKGEIDLVFKITENKSLKVRKITFQGNHFFTSGKLKRLMRTKEKGLLSFITSSGKYQEEMVERDVAFLNYQYLNFGFLKVQVDKPEVVPLGVGHSGIELKFRIDEGDRYRIRDLKINGDILTTPEEVRRQFETQKGQYFSQKRLEEDVGRVAQLYGNQGYAFANIRPRPLPDDSKLEVDVDVNIEKGEKVGIDKINITGNNITRDKVLRRELKVKENSMYSEQLVRESKARLEALGFFETVEFSTPKGSRENTLDLNIHVKEKPTGSFNVGAGFSSAESFLFNASVSKQNFLGLGLSSSLIAEVSKKRQQFSLQIDDPYFLDSRWILSTSVAKLLTRYDDFTRDALNGSMSFGRYFLDHSSVSLGYKIEKVRADEFSAFVPSFFKKNASGLTSSLLFSTQRDTRNNRLIASKGSYLQGSVEYAGLGGDNDFLKLDGNALWFLPLPFFRFSEGSPARAATLKVNATLGYIRSLNNDPVPLFDRYFTGGVYSLRGFEPRSIGPSLQIPGSTTGKDHTFVYGGNKLETFNLEYEFPLLDAAGLRGVVFLDAGNSFAEDENLNPLKVRANWGAGFRWFSPLGPLRFEWGFPFKRKPGEKKSVFNFTIGTLF